MWPIWGTCPKEDLSVSGMMRWLIRVLLMVGCKKALPEGTEADTVSPPRIQGGFWQCGYPPRREGIGEQDLGNLIALVPPHILEVQLC